MVRFISILLFWLCLFSLANNNLSANSTTKKFVVVIDAGHGGNDPGAVGKKAKEKTINLNTALKLGKLIEQQCKDVKVVYTRKTDVFIPLNKRAQIANNAKADLFISIHTNALPKGKITFGAETYTLGMARADENLEVAKKENSVILMEDDYKQTYKGFNPNSPESYIIFEFMQDKNMSQSINFAKKIQQQFKRAGRTDKGVHQAGFLVLRETAMPSVLVELGYISTPKEESFLNSSDGTSKMANSIFQAFNEYRKNHES
ncbi:MAG: N-acetylmuramoyl-L-alanine amidase, partial [Bacteroidaceae bacterium]|nr:N-acetylmuramoyl-L-alanine amidase [Bacteroidaceae bacterium]MCF0185786.1 N-acetylmuramoyl-L-alanine amidase [Bacteroidaceae bacterium]